MTETKRELVVGAALILLSIVLLFEASTIPGPRYEPLGPRFMAVLIPSLILVLSIGSIARALKARGTQTEASAPFPVVAFVRALATFGALIVYAAALEARLGFGFYVFSTATFFVVASFCTERISTLRGLLLTIVIGTGMAFGIAWLFTEILYVSLPS